MDHDQRTPGEPVESEPVDLSLARRLKAYQRLVDGAERAFDRNEPVDPVELRQAFEEAFPMPTAEAGRTLTLSDALRRGMGDVRARAEGRVRPVPTPFPMLDEDLRGGFYVGNHILVSATGVGKTTMGTACAMTAARAGHVVAIAAIEMGADEQAIRLASEVAGLPFSVGMTDPSPAQADRLEAAAQEIKGLPILIDDMNPNGWSSDDLERLCKRARSLAAERGADGLVPLVVVDFLQIMGARPQDRGDTRERISRAAYSARTLAKDHQVAILLISSTARHGYNLSSGNPKALADHGVRLDVEVATGAVVGRPCLGASNLVGLGKESGETEYSATSVMVLMKVPGEDGARRAIVLAKNRNARRETWIPMRFDNARWSEASDQEAVAMADALRPPQRGGASAEVKVSRTTAIVDATLEALEGGPLSQGALRTSVREILHRETGKGGSQKALDHVRDELLGTGEIADLGGDQGHRYALAAFQAVDSDESKTTPAQGVSQPCPGELAACPASPGKEKGGSLPPDRVGKPHRGSHRSGKRSPVAVRDTGARMNLEATRRAAILDFVAKHPEPSKRALRSAITGKAVAIDASVLALVEAGKLLLSEGGSVRVPTLPAGVSRPVSRGGEDTRDTLAGHAGGTRSEDTVPGHGQEAC